MRLIDAIGSIISRNATIDIWEKHVNHLGESILVWHGEAWKLPLQYHNEVMWQIFTTVPEDLLGDECAVNIRILKGNGSNE